MAGGTDCTDGRIRSVRMRQRFREASVSSDSKNRCYDGARPSSLHIRSSGHSQWMVLPPALIPTRRPSSGSCLGFERPQLCRQVMGSPRVLPRRATPSTETAEKHRFSYRQTPESRYRLKIVALSAGSYPNLRRGGKVFITRLPASRTHRRSLLSVYLGALSALSRPRLLRRFIRSTQLQPGLGIPFSRGQASRAICLRGHAHCF